MKDNPFQWLADVPADVQTAFAKRLTGEALPADRAADLFSRYTNKFTRKTIEKPVIYLGMGTCGLGAGAAAVKKAALQYLEESGIDAETLDVGCIGYCSAEPLMDIQVPGKARVSFQNVTPEKVPELIAGVLNGNISAEYVLGQFAGNGHAPCFHRSPPAADLSEKRLVLVIDTPGRVNA